MPDGYVPAHQDEVAVKRGWTAGRVVLAGAIAAGAVLAALATSAEEAARATQAAGPELARLLRAMAALKLTLAGGLLAAATWRLASPAAAWRLACYALAAAAMTAGPVLIWQMAHIGVGALLLHGGLVTGALLLWRDPAVGTRLANIVAKRRADILARR